MCGPRVKNISNGEEMLCEIVQKKVDELFFLLSQLVKNSDTFMVSGIVGLLFADSGSTMEQTVVGPMG